MTILSLAPSLDTAAAAPLREQLLARLDAGEPLLMDGAEVARVGQACLQVLASARAAAAAQDLPFGIANASTALADMVALTRLDAVLEPSVEG